MMKPVNSDLRETPPKETSLQEDILTMMKLVNSDLQEIRPAETPLQDAGVELHRCLHQMVVLMDV